MGKRGKSDNKKKNEEIEEDDLEFSVKIVNEPGVKELYMSNIKTIEDNDSSESESDESSEDDEKGSMAPKVADRFLELLPKIVQKHPDIYQDKKFFEDEIEVDSEEEDDDNEKVTFKDVMRKDILSKMDKEDGYSSEEEEQVKPEKPKKKKTYDEELSDIKNEFLRAAEGLGNEDDDDLYHRKEKTESEIEEFENEYHKFLRVQEAKAKDDETLNTLAQFWTEREDLDEKDKYLRDFIMNKRWLEKDHEKEEVIDDVADQEALNNQEDFEVVYNFRYEEPDGNKIMLFSRHQDDSARLKKEKRKEARKRRSERQRIKKEQMKAEKIALKKEKKKEIWNKLKDIANKSGIEDEALARLSLDSDFDPDLFDKDIDKLFGKDQAVAEEFEKYLEEYHQLDYEDIIGGMAVRFKYRKVDPVNFGLSAKEILEMDDEELNQIVPLKAYAPYRDEKELSKWKYKRKSRPKKTNK